MSFFQSASLLFSIALGLKLVLSQDFVEVEAIDEDIAYFSYHDNNGSGFIYISTTSKVSLTDFRGQEIVLISEESDNEEQRAVRVLNDLFLQSKFNGRYMDYYIPAYLQHGMTSRLNDSVIHYLRALPSYYHFTKLKETYERLLSTAAAQSIIKSAIILGEHLNYTGINYPLLLPLYVTAHLLHQKVKESEVCIRRRKLQDEDDSCFDECPPCPEQECLSLCGYGCSCWKWVCGDCCYHLGCYGHDVCCREKFIQTKCLFPISFKCDSEYEC